MSLLICTIFLTRRRLVANLDLVITVDTAAAHLAGALNKPVWLMIPFAGEWRWLADRDTSPWYPCAASFVSRDRAIGTL